MIDDDSTPLERHMISTNVRSRRFILFFFGWIALASIWPLATLVIFRNSPHLNEIKHEVTFVWIHFTTFPFAVGWTAANISMTFLFPNLKFGNWCTWIQNWRVWFLAVLCGAMAVSSLSYEMNGFLPTRNLPDHSSPKNLTLDKERRKLQQDIRRQRLLVEASRPNSILCLQEFEKFETTLASKEATYNDPKSEFLVLHKRSGGVAGIFNGNPLNPIGAALTLVFQMFCVFVVFVVAMHIVSARYEDQSTIRARTSWITTTLLAVCTWIPCRAYADYSIREIGMIPCQSEAVVFAGLMATLVFTSLIVNQLLYDRATWETVKYGTGLLCGITGVTLSQFSSLCDIVHAVIESMPVLFHILLCFVAMIMSMFLGMNALHSIQVMQKSNNVTGYDSSA